MAGLTLWLGVLYLPYVGRGFLKDDFRWIAEGRIESVDDLLRIVTGNLGFYRPVVTLTFGFDYALYGLHAYGYALTNFGLLVACVGQSLTLTSSTVDNPPSPCAPIPSAFTLS